MPFYLLSSVSSIKNNEYKFGYSSKEKNVLLKQYEKNKRLIVNPFIVQWWDIQGSLKLEKEIHIILRNIKEIDHVSGEWYNCDNLLYLLNVINNKLNNINEIESSSNIVFFEEKVKNNMENCIYILNKKNKQQIFIKYDFIKLFNIEHLKNIIKNISININNVKYLEYEFFIWFFKKYVKDEKIKNIIIKELNKNIIHYVNNMDDSYFKLIFDKINLMNNSYNLSYIKKEDYIDIQLNSFYIPKDNLTIFSKQYILQNQKCIFKEIYNNIIYFIDEINIKNIIIKLDINKKTIYYTIEEYIKNIKDILSLNKMIKNHEIKIYKRIYYSFNVVLLNKCINTLNYYNLLDLKDNDVFYLILNENLYEDINIYLKNEIIVIKKFTIYQLLNYYSKKKYGKTKCIRNKIYCGYKNKKSYCDRCLEYIKTCECGKNFVSYKNYITMCKNCDSDQTSSEDEFNEVHYKSDYSFKDIELEIAKLKI